MKSYLLLLLLIASPLHAALKWERLVQTVEWKPGKNEVTVEFAYKNAGKVAQKITSLKGACVCCTSASASKKDLAPGESGVIRMRVDFRGKTLPIAKAIAVTTDDKQVVSLVVQVKTPGDKQVAIPRWNVRK